MDLDVFIKESLTRIITGIEAANAEIKVVERNPEAPHTRSRVFDLPTGTDKGKTTGVDFDIAVTSKSEAGGDGQVKARIWVIEAQLGGNASVAHETISRIKFTAFVRN